MTVTAPVDGHVAVVASGYMIEADDEEKITCGSMDEVSSPPNGAKVRWSSGTGDDELAHLSAGRVFELAKDATATYYLVCANETPTNLESQVQSPQLTAIFTPAP